MRARMNCIGTGSHRNRPESGVVLVDRGRRYSCGSQVLLQGCWEARLERAGHDLTVLEIQLELFRYRRGIPSSWCGFAEDVLLLLLLLCDVTREI